LENRRSKNNKVSRRVWEAVKIKAEEVGMEKVKKKKKRERRKEKRKERTKIKGEEKT